MMDRIEKMRVSDDTIDLVFRKARTYNAWLPKPVPEELLRQLYDHEPIERPIIPGRNSWGEMDARFSHRHSWAGSIISSCLPTILELNDSRAH
jgi:hypothetical protein